MLMQMLKKQWKDLVKYKPVAFGIESGFEDLTDLHNEWIRSFLYSEDDMTLQAHRGSYKTTSLAIALALMIIIYPKKNMIMLREADDVVKEIITQVANLLETDMFKSFVKVVYNVDLKLTRQSSYEVETNLKESSKGAPQLLGLGAGASMTGKHADIVITDDIVTVKDRISPAHRKQTKLIYQELENIKNRGGRFINTGTPWHKEDAFELMPNLKRFDVHTTGLVSEEEIEDLRKKMTPSLFAANYELKHISDEDTLFHNPIIDNGNNTHLIYDGFAHIDASYGGADSSAFTVLKRQPDGKIYVYGALRQEHIDDVLPTFEDKRTLYRAGKLYNETNADKGYLVKKVKAPVGKYHEKMNKHLKISTYLRENWENIIFIKDTEPEYINQILEYNENVQHDDAPDSLSSLIRETEQNKVTVQLFKHSF